MEAVKIMIVLYVIGFWLPARIWRLPIRGSLLDRFIVVVPISAGMTISIVYCLAAVKQYTILTLTAGWIITANVIAMFIQRLNWKTYCFGIVKYWLIWLAEYLDRDQQGSVSKNSDNLNSGKPNSDKANNRDEDNENQRFNRRYKEWFRYLRNVKVPKAFIESYIKKHFKPHRLALVLLLILALYVRIHDNLGLVAPPMADAYVAMAWAKYINLNTLFRDGVYPQGFYIILSVLSKTTGLDLVHILRFTGSIINTTNLLWIYYLVSRPTKNPWAGIIAAAIGGIILNDWFLRDWARETASLAQEFGMFFLLPNLYFSSQWLYFDKRPFLWYWTASLITILYIHPIAGLGALLGIIAQFLALMAKPRTLYRKFKEILPFGFGGAIIGVLPLIIGRLLYPFHGSSAEYAFAVTYSASWTIGYMGLAGLGLVLYLANLKHPHRVWVFIWFGLSLLAYFARDLGFKYMFDPARVLILVALAGYLIIGQIWAILRLKQVITLGMIGALIYIYPLEPIRNYRMEYDPFPRWYLWARANLPGLQWTIVSQVEQYPMVLGYGWHINVGEFVAQQNPAKFKSPTPYMLIFIEKVPFKIPVRETQRNFRVRQKEEGQLMQWWADYQRLHKQSEILYQDQKVLIGLIQTPTQEKPTIER